MDCRPRDHRETRAPRQQWTTNARALVLREGHLHEWPYPLFVLPGGALRLDRYDLVTPQRR